MSKSLGNIMSLMTIIKGRLVSGQHLISFAPLATMVLG
jgi:hypothetical protein